MIVTISSRLSVIGCFQRRITDALPVKRNLPASVNAIARPSLSASSKIWRAVIRRSRLVFGQHRFPRLGRLPFVTLRRCHDHSLAPYADLRDGVAAGATPKPDSAGVCPTLVRHVQMHASPTLEPRQSAQMVVEVGLIRAFQLNDELAFMLLHEGGQPVNRGPLPAQT